jgi:hypothetical protein
MNKYIKILEYCDKNFIYFYAPILPWLIDFFFPNILNLFTYDDYWLPTSIIGKIYVLGYVYPYIFFIVYPNLIREIILNLNNVTKKLFYSRLTVLQFIAAILLIIALFDIQAMGYFTFLRIYIFSVGILSMYQFYKASEKADNEDQKNLLGGSALFSFIFAVLFNPIFPVYFWDKTPWYWIDSIAALYFLLWVFVNDYRIPKN